MGCDSYDFTAYCSSGNAIMVANKDIRQVQSPDGLKSVEENYDIFPDSDELSDEEVEWLLNQTEGFTVYQLGKKICLFMKGGETLHEVPKVGVPGPYEIENHFVQIDIDKASQGDEYDDLFNLARKLTPQARKISCAPGKYRISMTEGYLLGAEKLERAIETVKDESREAMNVQEPPGETETIVVTDFKLIVGTGERQKTFDVNKAVLACVFPGFEAFAGDLLRSEKFDLPELDPEAVGLVLGMFCTRKQGISMPSRWSNRTLYDAVNLVKEKFGAVDEKCREEHIAQRAKTEHPALSDTRWLDATFLVGPEKEEIKASGAMLAAMNPVLRRILYGTGFISVDPSKPIEWPQFDVKAVQRVFLALVQRCKKEVVVPVESVNSAQALVDYLMETPESLNLYLETPFKREFEGGFRLDTYYDKESGVEGLKLG